MEHPALSQPRLLLGLQSLLRVLGNKWEFGVTSFQNSPLCGNSCSNNSYQRIYKCKLRLLDDEEILDREEYSQFTEIVLEDLQMQLNRENERASAINEKTYKMGLSLSIALAITGYALTALPDQISYSVAKTCISVPIIFSVFYFMAAGVTALGSIKTERIYGFTAQILLLGEDEQQQCFAKCLAQSEVMNNIRHLRNEAVYQCLHRGYYLLVVAIALFTGSHIFEFFSQSINQLECRNIVIA